MVSLLRSARASVSRWLARAAAARARSGAALSVSTTRIEERYSLTMYCWRRPQPGDSQEQRLAIQIIFQNPERSLNPNETVDIAIQRPLRLFGVADYAARRQQAIALLGQVRLPDKMLDRYPRELSGGEKQRVAIARALAAHPSVLLCDEITSSLDVSTQAAIVALLEELKAGGLALLFITHNLALVHSIADRILVLESGEIRELGMASEVIAHPRHRYTKTLIVSRSRTRSRVASSPSLRLVDNDRIEVPR